MSAGLAKRQQVAQVQQVLSVRPDHREEMEEDQQGADDRECRQLDGQSLRREHRQGDHDQQEEDAHLKGRDDFRAYHELVGPPLVDADGAANPVLWEGKAGGD